MIKTLRNLLKQDKERFVVPRGVQDVIPIKAIYDDGIFQVGRDKFSKTYKFSDINYAVASREDKEAMFLEYSELLNSLDSGATTKITINNRRLNRANFEKTILLPLKGDALDEYREEYNRMLLDKATGANAIIQEKYITISVCKKNVEEARNYFARVGADLIAHFGRLGSKCVELEPDERLRIFHDFYRAGEETEFRFDIKETRRKGHDFKDFICPDSMEFTGDYFKIGERYGRVLFLREYASYIKDSMVAEMTDLNRNLMMSIDVIPVPTDEAVREAESRLLGVETNATNWQRRQNANNNFSAQLPYDIEQQRKEMKEFLDDLTTRDQRMMFAVLTMVHTADTKEQLDNDTEALLTTARKHLCQFGILKFQQLDGLNTAMPFGVRKIESFRTLTTESLAVFIPFRVQDICHTNGVYYGQNVISKNMIIADRRQLLNGNEFILGVSGGGKSFTAKGEVINQVLAGNADIIIIDPEREYSPLVRALGGEIINISATSPTHINAMDMNREYGDGANPVILKSEFIMSLCEQLIGGNNLGAAASAATGFELLSNQLSNWLSTDDYNIVFRYRPKSELSGDEVDFGFSKSLINNRLFVEVEGNYMLDNSQAVNKQMSNFMGEAYVTWLIDRAGTLKLKGFTQTIDRFDENQGLQETGIGIYYKEDFNNLKDLKERLKNKFRSRRKRQQLLERRRAADSVRRAAPADTVSSASVKKDKNLNK